MTDDNNIVDITGRVLSSDQKAEILEEMLQDGMNRHNIGLSLWHYGANKELGPHLTLALMIRFMGKLIQLTLPDTAGRELLVDTVHTLLRRATGLVGGGEDTGDSHD